MQTKERIPVPGDVIKTSASMNNTQVPYMVARRALNNDALQQKQVSVKNFQLIVPYLDKLRKSNPMSVIGYTRQDTFNIVDLHFFPGFVDKVLNFV